MKNGNVSFKEPMNFYFVYSVMKCFLLGVVVCVTMGIGVFSLAWAADSSPFVLIPEAKDNYGTTVDNLTDITKAEGKKFRNAYNTKADGYIGKKDSETQCDLWSMLGSGIVTWDTILCLLIRIVKFVANMWLVVGAGTIIYAWYLYAISALSGTSVDDTSKANDAIKSVAIGIVIITFSYAIQRIVSQAFLT